MKSLPLIAFIAVAWTITQIDAIADSPAMPVPWVKTTERGNFLFKMVPPKWREEGENFVTERDAFGVAYQITEDGEFHELWRTNGWYTFEGYLSEDGKYFVRFGP